MRILYTLTFLSSVFLGSVSANAQEKERSQRLPDTTAQKQKLDVDQLNFQPSEAEDVLLASNPFRNLDARVEATITSSGSLRQTLISSITSTAIASPACPA